MRTPLSEVDDIELDHSWLAYVSTEIYAQRLDNPINNSKQIQAGATTATT